MIYSMMYMLTGLAIIVWRFSDADRQSCFMEIVRRSEALGPWLGALAVAVGVFVAALLWPIVLASFIKEITENK